MLVTPGMGHLIPLAELAKRLAAWHGVTATLVTFASTASAMQRGFLASLPPDTTRLVAYFADLFGANSFNATAVAAVPRRYLFFPGNLQGLAIILHLPELDISMPSEFRDLAEPVRLPACMPIPGADILSPLQDKSSPSYRWMVHHGLALS
ncbi:hypothetical protein ZWY2020_016181 [Hordeum vulgare]|nr:hypothetical protein ZWY2020_016181 [Hordeum vulgare]